MRQRAPAVVASGADLPDAPWLSVPAHVPTYVPRQIAANGAAHGSMQRELGFASYPSCATACVMPRACWLALSIS